MESRQLLSAHTWPGNLAELYCVLLGACERAKGPSVEPGDLPYYLRQGPAPASASLPLDALLEQVERKLLVLALKLAKNKKASGGTVGHLAAAPASPPGSTGDHGLMKHAVLFTVGVEGRLAELLAEWAGQRGLAHRLIRHARACLNLVRHNPAAVVVLKLGRDLEKELTLLQRSAPIIQSTLPRRRRRGQCRPGRALLGPGRVPRVVSAPT